VWAMSCLPRYRIWNRPELNKRFQHSFACVAKVGGLEEIMIWSVLTLFMHSFLYKFSCSICSLSFRQTRSWPIFWMVPCRLTLH
jgi:hypothetical protein